MDDRIKDPYDNVSDMIENNTETTRHPSPEDMMKAMRSLALSVDERGSHDPWLDRYHTLPSYKLDVVRDDSDEYFKKLTEAITSLTKDNFGSIDYKGYKIYYNDTPQICGISLDDGHKEYCYYAGFHCEALMCEYYEEYHSEDERNAFLDPKKDLFKKTLALLDKEIEKLDEGKWIRKKNTLKLYDFRDYSPDILYPKTIKWDDRCRDASDTFSFLVEDALTRTKDMPYTEDDFEIFSDVIRRMVFFADYGKRNYLTKLQGFIWYKWKPKTKRNRYIWLCMHEFGQGDLPDRLLDNCSLYYFINDPHGWEALAYLIPIAALLEMCEDYEPNNVKKVLFKVFDLIPGSGYVERIENLIEEDRAKAIKEGYKDDEENL